MPKGRIAKTLTKRVLERVVRFLKLAFVFVVVASVGLLMGVKGLTQKHKQEENRFLLQKENERLQVEIKLLERDLTLIRDNPQTIEKIAKRRLGMARPDETVYIFEGGLTSSIYNNDAEIKLDKP